MNTLNTIPFEIIDEITRHTAFDNYRDYLNYRSSNAYIREVLIDLEKDSKVIREFLIPLVVAQYAKLDVKGRSKFSRSTPYVNEVTTVLKNVEKMDIGDNKSENEYEAYKNSSHFVHTILQYAEKVNVTYTKIVDIETHDIDIVRAALNVFPEIGAKYNFIIDRYLYLRTIRPTGNATRDMRPILTIRLAKLNLGMGDSLASITLTAGISNEHVGGSNSGDSITINGEFEKYDIYNQFGTWSMNETTNRVPI